MPPFWTRLRGWLSSPCTTRPLAIGAATRLAIFVLAAGGLGLLGRVDPGPFLMHGQGPHPCPAVDLFQRWDSYWFLNVARGGYAYTGVQEQLDGVAPRPRETNITPFPLYPALMAAGERLFGDASVAGLLISLLCYLAALLVLYRRIAAREDEGVAFRTALFLSVYPTAFIYNAIYSESLFLLLTLLCLTASEDGRPLRAGLFGLLASLTRLAGGLMAPCLLLDGALRRSVPRVRTLGLALLAAALTSLGWLGYFLYLRGMTGSLWSYFTAQQGWHKQLVTPWTALATIGGSLGHGDPAAAGDLAAALLFLWLAVRGIRRLPPGQALYLVLGLLMPLCSSNPLGLPRYLMVLFPAFLLLGRSVRSPRATAALAALFFLLLGPVMFAWLRWEVSL